MGSKGYKPYYRIKLQYLAMQEVAHGPEIRKVQAFARQCVAKTVVAKMREEESAKAPERLKEQQEREEQQAMLALQRQQEECYAATKVQGLRRAQLARRELGVRKEARDEELALIRADVAAKTLQCFCRIQNAKKTLLGMMQQRIEQIALERKSAVIIQARIRGVLARMKWGRWLHERSAVDREVTRDSAMAIQRAWRCYYARSEMSRRAMKRDAKRRAKQVEEALQAMMEPELYAQRLEAFITRIQSWWRAVLARKRVELLFKDRAEAPLREEKEAAEAGALCIQRYYRGWKAREEFAANYSNLYAAKEKLKCCVECETGYAARRCTTCRDQFCSSCWDYIHNKGQKRFHQWQDLPYESEAYAATYGYSQNTDYYGSTYRTADGTGITADPNLTETAMFGSEFNATEGGGEEWQQGGYYDETGTWVQGSSSEPLGAASGSYGTTYEGYEGYEGYESYEGYDATGYAASAYDYTAAVTGYDYSTGGYDTATSSYEGGSYDASGQGAANSYSTGHDTGYDAASGGYYDENGQWQYTGADAAAGYYDATGQWQYTGAGYYDETGSALTEGDLSYASSQDTTGGTGTEPSYTYNEYGQRTLGDWTEYYDESAQASYWYHNTTGEASWTEPVV
ncbi:unnamed protein product [Chrysoparadoxa australica]